jgi:hypothetical protein
LCSYIARDDPVIAASTTKYLLRSLEPEPHYTPPFSPKLELLDQQTKRNKKDNRNFGNIRSKKAVLLAENKKLQEEKAALEAALKEQQPLPQKRKKRAPAPAPAPPPKRQKVMTDADKAERWRQKQEEEKKLRIAQNYKIAKEFLLQQQPEEIFDQNMKLFMYKNNVK